MLILKEKCYLIVRTYNKDDNNKAESANEEITLKLNVPRRFYGLIIGKFEFFFKINFLFLFFCFNKITNFNRKRRL